MKPTETRNPLNTSTSAQPARGHQNHRQARPRGHVTGATARLIRPGTSRGALGSEGVPTPVGPVDRVAPGDAALHTPA